MAELILTARLGYDHDFDYLLPSVRIIPLVKISPVLRRKLIVSIFYYLSSLYRVYPSLSCDQRVTEEETI